LNVSEIIELLHHHLLAVLNDDALVVSINLLTGEVVADSGLWRFLGDA